MACICLLQHSHLQHLQSTAIPQPPCRPPPYHAACWPNESPHQLLFTLQNCLYSSPVWTIPWRIPPSLHCLQNTLCTILHTHYHTVWQFYLYLTMSILRTNVFSFFHISWQVVSKKYIYICILSDEIKENWHSAKSAYYTHSKSVRRQFCICLRWWWYQSANVVTQDRERWPVTTRMCTHGPPLLNDTA